jgi:hypothetical protein
LNNLKKLKLLVASALLSSTAVYADDCTDTSATNCGITISGNQTIDIGSSISTTNKLGVQITGDSNTLTIDGDITVNSSVNNAFGLNISNGGNNNNVINMTGDISTISTGGATGMHGIRIGSNSSSNTINVTGNVSTTRGNSSGILIIEGGDNNNVTLFGNINTSGGSNSNGVRITGQTNNFGINNTITVNGDVSSVYSHAIAITGYAHDSYIVVNGNVQSTNSAAIHISQTDTVNNIVTVNGNVSTSATSANPTIAFNSGASDNLVVIDGNVTQFANVPAIKFGANGTDTSHDNTVSVSGNITSAGTGIRFNNSDRNEIFVSGNIVARTPGANAIYADSESEDNTIYLDRSSTIVGAIRNNGTNNTLLFTAWEPIEPEDTDGDGVPDIDGDIDFEEITSGGQSQYGLATSANYTVSGTSPWVVQANVEQTVLTGNTYIKSMGVANIDDEGNRLYLRTTKINQNLTERTRAYAHNEVEPYWMNVYTTKSKRDEEYKEIHQNARGITIGGQLSQFNKPIDLIFNLENSDASYGLSEQHIESNSIMAGALIPQIANLFDGDLSAKVLVGMSDNDTKRTVLNNLADDGSEKVTGDYDSTYLVIGAEWLKTVLTKGNTNNDVVLGLDFSQEYLDSYNESKYYHLDSRDISQVTARVKYGLTYHEKDSPFTANTRFGIAHRKMVSGEKQDYQIDGLSASFKGDEENTYFNVGVGLDYQLTNGIKAYVAGNFMDSSDEIHSVSGSFGVMGSF